MDIHDVNNRARDAGGEYVLGSEVLRTHACYLVYGILGPREKGRTIKPGNGHEEIVCLVSGSVSLSGEGGTFSLQPGQSFHLRGEELFFMENTGSGEAVYIIAGGHSEHHSH